MSGRFITIIIQNMKVTPEIKKDFQNALELLPSGSINKIAERTKKKQAYVSRFLRGDYEITPDNENIIDVMISILEESHMRAQKFHKKLSEAINT